MPLLTDDIKNILEAGGHFRFPNPGGLEPHDPKSDDPVVKGSYTMNKLSVDIGKKIVFIERVALDATTANCVNVHTLDQVSAIGAIDLPGYVYTGNFSGCVFYLYKTGPNQVTGVHAYNGFVEHRVKRFLRKPKITQVVHEFSPTSFYTRTGVGQPICRYPTRGELLTGGKIGDGTGESSLNYLSCVERTKATTFLFSFSAGYSPNGAKVGRLLATHEVMF